MLTFIKFVQQLLEDRDNEWSANFELSNKKPKRSPFTILDSKGFQKFFEPYDDNKGQASKYFRVIDAAIVERDFPGFLAVLSVISTSDAGLELVKSENRKAVPLSSSEKLNKSKILELIKQNKNYFVMNTYR
jgi:hypothetical protein